MAKEKKAKLELTGMKPYYLIKGVELSFNSLVVPETTGKYPSNAYKLDGFVSKEVYKEVLGEVLKDIMKAGAQLHGKKLPWSACTDSVVDMDAKLASDESDEDDKYRHLKEGRIRIRTKSKKVRPAVVGPDKTKYTDDDIEGMRMGDTVNLLVNIWPWEMKKEVEQVDAKGNVKKVWKHEKKVSLGLLSVQHVKRNSGDNTGLAMSAFEEEVDSIEGMTSDNGIPDDVEFDDAEFEG